MSALESALSKAIGDEAEQACIQEHCYYCFDTLFCALTPKKPVSPKFPDGK